MALAPPDGLRISTCLVLEIRWAPAPHIIIAFNLAGFKPGRFFNTITYNAGPIAGNVGFTYRF